MLKDLKIGPNESVLVILDDNSFVEVTTTTKPIEIGNSFEKKHGGITTMDYTSDYDMSGTRWNTEYKYEVGFNSATLILNTYYEIGSKMYIYDTDTSGTEGSLGISVTSSTSVSNNNTATATAKGTYNLKKLGGSTETYTLYTEVGFLGSFVDPYGYHYVSYYTDSWKS